MHITTLGEILIDMFPAEVGRRLVEVSAFRPKPGGAPANVAVAARRLGAESAFIGKVGDDAFGEFLVDVLRREGVETRGMRVDDYARTTMAIIAMPDPHTAEFVFYRNPGADLRLQPDELDRDLLRQSRVLHIGSLSLVDEPARSATFAAVDMAREAGALVSFDVNYRPSLWRGPAEALAQIEAMLPHVHLVKVNELELALLHSQDVPVTDPDGLGMAADALRAKAGLHAVIVTRGAAGSYGCLAEGGVHVPAFAVNTVDATGCGDAFVGGLLTRLAGPGDWRAELTLARLRSAMRYASAVGALTAQTQGAIPALPTAAAVDAFLDHHPEQE